MVEEAEPAAPARSYVVGSFDAFFTAEYHRLLAFARAVAGSWSAAEDLTQEAFTAAHTKWREVSRYDRPDLFLRRVVTNRVTSERRRSGREQRAFARLWPRQESVEEALPDAELWRSIATLPPQQRVTIVLRYVEDRTVGDIAEILSLAPGTVAAHLHAARRALAVTLDCPLEDS
jgi:RNA polymerase sigma factor (sigma-70 family)